ncbi:MAG TPA: HD domain-containing phosphohydrolase [Anaerolineales bacterium]|jgi:putative two-component system response regulator
MADQSRILVVDDESIARITIDALLSAENYVMFFAENGEEGIKIAAEIQPDIILLDVMMPGLNGFETCRKIRSMPDLAEVPILLVTALDDRESRMAGLQAGADDFITKPYDIFELQVRIQNMTRLNRYRLLTEQRQEMENLHREVVTAYDQTIEGWSKALDLRDKETEGHTKRVSEMTKQLARAAGFDAEALLQIQRGALLHDVGKLGIPDKILLKPEPLTRDEWMIMRKHPVYAYEWLSAIDYLHVALEIPYCHHEKWDGTGYPRGLKGEDIPMAARLFAVVDVWDALTSDRPYRKALSDADAWKYILDQNGHHFDPRAVEAFAKSFDKPLVMTGK